MATMFAAFAEWERKLRARATDTGGNEAWTPEYVLELVPEQDLVVAGAWVRSEERPRWDQREQVAACDVTVSLPMRGRVSSLNLAVAAGILLYALNA